MENDNGIVLLYDAGKAVGGVWESRTESRYHSLVVERGTTFLDGYRSSVSFMVQSQSSAFAIRDNYPAGWTILGSNTWQNRYKTTLSREHASGGRGVIWTYDPQQLTEPAKNIFMMILEWTGGETLVPGVTVPSGDIAFVIQGWDDETPELTSRENAIRQRLVDLGESITYIRFGRLRNSDLSQAKYVVGTEYPSLDSNTINDLTRNNQRVLLFYSAGSTVGGVWESRWEDRYLSLVIEHGTTFLDGFRSSVSFMVQSQSFAFAIRDDYPAGWTILGRNTWQNRYKNTLVREHASGGRGVIWTYDPEHLTEQGENLFMMILEWTEGKTLLPGVTVPSGDIAFVIQGWDDETPVLTSRENAISQRLEDLGENITYIRFGRLRNSDLSQAKYVVGTEYPSLDSNTINDLITNNQRVLLFYTAGSTVGGVWESRSEDRYRSLVIENATTFLDGYTLSMSFLMQSQSFAFAIRDDYPAGWTILGSNTWQNRYKAALSREHQSNGRGAIFTYDPQYFTDEGDTVFNKIIEWIE